MILSVYANNQAILPTLYALYDTQRLYLPLSELARELGLPVTPNTEDRQVAVTAAYSLPTYQIYLQDDGQLRVEQPGEEPLLWPADAWLADLWEMDGELYLAREYMAQLWPIEFDFNLSRLRLDLNTDEPLPELEARARQRLRELRLRDVQPDDLVSPGLPYAMASPPLVEWNARYNTSSRRENYGLIARHDLFGFGHEWQAQLTNSEYRDDYQLTRLRWKGRYFAADTGQPAPLFGQIQQLEVGDIRTDALEGAPRSTQGRGLHLSSFKASQRSVFDTQRITGFAPPEWEADLYINQQLVDYQVVGESGTYEFDALLQQGHNRVEVRLFGPLGEERIDRFNFQLGQDYLERGDFAVSLNVFQPEQDLLGLEEERTPALYQPDLATEVDLGVGLGPGLSLRGHWRNQLFQDDFDESGANQLGWTLGGNWGLWSWQWQQLFEGSDHFTRLETLRSTNNFHLGLSFLDHPDWGVYEREGRLVDREYRLRTHYQLTPWRYFPLRLGLNAHREESDLFNEDEFELTQQFRLFRWAFNFSQRCTFYDNGLNDLCTFGHSTRYSYAGIRASLDTNSDRVEDSSGWQRHEWRTQLNYDLGRPFQQTDWAGWAEDFQLQGEYGQTHYPNLGLERNDRWSYELTWQQTLRYLKLGWSAGRDSRDGWNASVQLSGSLLPGLDGYNAIGNQLYRPAHLQAFDDHNYDGKRQPGEAFIPGAAFRQGSRSSDPADAKGRAWVNLLPTSELDLDLRSVEDPYIISGREPLRLASRPERVVQLQWPLIETGALDGELLSPDGRPLINQRLELRRPDQTLVDVMYTAFDGFWAFEFVPPGDYEIHWVQSAEETLLAQLELSPQDPWLSLNLDINEPVMIAAAVAEEPEELPSAVQQAQISSRQAFLQRFLDRNYLLLAVEEDTAVLLDELNYSLVRIQLGESFSRYEGSLAAVGDDFAEFHFGSLPYVARLPLAYRYKDTRIGLISGEKEARLLWKDKSPDDVFPYDSVSAGSQLNAGGQVIAVEDDRVIVEWVGERLVLGAQEKTASQEAASQASPKATTAASKILPLDSQPSDPQPSDHYALQLMSSSSEKAVQGFIARHRETGALNYYQREHASLPWVVIMGSYPTRADAEAALESLPQALRQLKPWIRRYNRIQEEALY